MTWISTEDELPQINTVILMWVREVMINNEVRSGAFMGNKEGDISGEWFYRIDFWKGELRPDQVTHWQYTPKPPIEI